MWALPVGNPWHDDPFYIRKDLVKFFTLMRSLVWQKLPQISWFHIGKDSSFSDVLEVVGDVIDHLLAYEIIVEFVSLLTEFMHNINRSLLATVGLEVELEWFLGLTIENQVSNITAATSWVGWGKP